MNAKVDVTVKIPAIEQLLTVTASGVGSVAGPMLATWRARQEAEAKRIRAEAEADVLQIRAEAQSKAREALVPSGAQTVGELSIGALIEQRVRFQEEKRQANITSVVAEAAWRVEGVEVDSSEPDHDWAARFFGDVQDVSSKEMQTLWAAVLAGEVVRKGSVSVHALHVLKNLDQATARHFKRLCSCCVYAPARRFGRAGADARVPSLGGSASQNALRPYGLSFDILNHLNEHGLIVSDYNSYFESYFSMVAGKPATLPFEFQGTQWGLFPHGGTTPSWDGKLSGVALSQAGRDLATAVELEAVPEFESALRTYFEGIGLPMQPLARTSVQPP